MPFLLTRIEKKYLPPVIGSPIWYYAVRIELVTSRVCSTIGYNDERFFGRRRRSRSIMNVSKELRVTFSGVYINNEMSNDNNA